MALFNNLDTIRGVSFFCPEHVDERAKLALEIDRTIRESAPPAGVAIKHAKHRS